MRLGGLQKLSLIDFPKKLAAVVFTQGCPFRCHFCHNESLVIPEKFSSSLDEEDFFSFLRSRKNRLDGVVISGGEPTIQKDLISFIERIKDIGFAVKLDTSGICPEVLKELLQKNLLDYVAMDIKAPFEKYEKVIGTKIDTEKIQDSINLLLNSKILFEFRTTLVPHFHSLDDIIVMAKMIKTAPVYILQKFIPTSTLTSFKNKKSFFEKELHPYIKEAKKHVKSCYYR